MADSGGGVPSPSYYLHSPTGDPTFMFSPTEAFAPPLQFPHSGVSGRATAAPAPVAVDPPRRKRGRPRKYGPPSATSASMLSTPAPKKKAPPALPLLHAPSSTAAAASPRKKLDVSQKSAHDALGLRCQGFTPHTIYVQDGEDVAQKILSFMHQKKQSVCIISASGSVCDVYLRQPANVGGLVLYEGLFEIVSFSGSLLYIVSSGGTTTRRGGMSICLIGADGRMIGGGVGTSLKAVGLVQVLASSFLINQAEAMESSDLSSNSDIGATPLTQAGEIQSSSNSITARIPAARHFDDYPFFRGGTNFAQHLPPVNAPLSYPEWQGSAGLEQITAYHPQEGSE